MFTTTSPGQKRGSRFRPPLPPSTAHAQSQHIIGFAGGLSLYGFVNANPVNAVDPDGLEPAGQVYGNVYRRYSKSMHRGGSYLYGTQGLATVMGILREVAARTDSNADFLDVAQSLFIADSGLNGLEKPILDVSKFQGKNLTMRPGMRGWHKSWRDGQCPGEDQAHHLVAFIIAGYKKGVGPASLLSDLHERRRPNQPDVDLGMLGAQYGDLLNFKETGEIEKDRRYRGHWLKALNDRLVNPDPFSP